MCQATLKGLKDNSVYLEIKSYTEQVIVMRNNQVLQDIYQKLVMLRVLTSGVYYKEKGNIVFDSIIKKKKGMII